jgi:hypothetical protein
MLAAFAVTIFISMLDRSPRAAVDRAAWPAQLIRSELGQPALAR